MRFSCGGSPRRLRKVFAAAWSKGSGPLIEVMKPEGKQGRAWPARVLRAGPGICDGVVWDGVSDGFSQELDLPVGLGV